MMNHRRPFFFGLVQLFVLSHQLNAEPAAMPDDPQCTTADRVFMARAFEAAKKAVENGSRPFGAVLVKDGQVIAEFGNCELITGDVTKHAETGLISAFSPKIDRATFAASTLYTSSEPCTMCCGAIRFAGIGRVVYGVTESQFVRIIGVPEGAHPLDSKEVFARTAPAITVLGPLMEAEGLALHESYWPAHPIPGLQPVGTAPAARPAPTTTATDPAAAQIQAVLNEKRECSAELTVPKGDALFLAYRSTLWQDYFQLAEQKVVPDFPARTLKFDLLFRVSTQEKEVSISFDLAPRAPNSVNLTGTTKMHGRPLVYRLPAEAVSVEPKLNSAAAFTPGRLTPLAQWDITYGDSRPADHVYLDGWIGPNPEVLKSQVTYSLEQGKRPPVTTFTDAVGFVRDGTK